MFFIFYFYLEFNLKTIFMFQNAADLNEKTLELKVNFTTLLAFKTTAFL